MTAVPDGDSLNVVIWSWGVLFVIVGKEVFIVQTGAWDGIYEPGLKIRALVCAPKIVCALVCASKLVGVLVYAPKLVYTPKLVWALVCGLICAPKLLFLSS